jgi:hypothetical protein
MIALARPRTLLFMKTSLLFENVGNDMSYKSSPSSSSEKPIYPHRVNHLLAFVPICDFMLLLYPDCLKIQSDGKQMMMMTMDNFWSQSRWRFRWKRFRIARLGAERPACENVFYKKKWNMAQPRFLLPPPPPPPLTKNLGYASGDFGGQWCFETFW